MVEDAFDFFGDPVTESSGGTRIEWSINVARHAIRAVAPAYRRMKEHIHELSEPCKEAMF